MQNLKGKRLLILGSSVWKDLIRSFADEYGVYLIFAGLYPAPLDDIADEYYRVDTTDRDIMIPFIKEHNIEGVYMGGSEFIISHACEWINEVGLPCYCRKEQWEILQNKDLFKDLCIKFDLPVVPRFVIDINNIASSVPENSYPVITKPTDGSGSNGFSVCHNSNELIKGYKIAADVSPTQSVICEKFVNNSGIVVFYSFSEGKMHFVLSEDKIPVKYEKQGSYVAGLFTCPSIIEKEFRERYDTKLSLLFSSIGIKEGTVWIEVFRDGDEFYFNEVGYRYGGSFSFYSVDYMSEVNQFYADLYYAVSGDSKLFGFHSLIPKEISKGINYCIYPVHCNSGKIIEERGVDIIKSKFTDQIVVVPHQKEIGDTIDDTGSFGQVICLFHFVYSTIEECHNIIRYIQDTYEVIDENGCNIVNNKLLL
ncbi:MAG: hypothetical protein IJZ87_04610 [Bacteroidales bacterium]|nr:hypothetical protein [Bacteroidales bacterium]